MMSKEGRQDIMLEIKGKVNTAVCYAKTVEDSAIEQIAECVITG